jgi:REP element-mobilizing transposase RayT
MSRPQRILHSDRVVHIYSHTIQEIRFTDEDRELLNNVIRTYTQKNDYTTYYSTVLGNHFHQLNQCFEDIDCSIHPKVLKQEMTRAYNRLHHRKGTIWWDRYDDVTILGETQLWRTLIYQACNQTRAGLAQSPFVERFSSMGAYLSRNDDGITTLLPQFLDLGETLEDCQEAFKQMVQEAMEIYADADAYMRMERLQGQRRLDFSWVADLRALEAHERRFLTKRRDEQNIIIITSADSQEGSCREECAQEAEAVLETGDNEAIPLSDEETNQLIRRGVPQRVIRLFFAPKDMILQIVTEHYKAFRLHAPP